jgi:putative Mg2+ transporter-C (MgtC) family protein
MFDEITESTIPLTTIIVRLGMAVILGTLVGLERESQRKPAGLRTHILVALGSASFVIVAIEFFNRIVSEAGPGEIRIDPLRIIEALVGGIGFLGAGSIIQSRGTVEGVTTAAGIWLMGAVGAACGTGAFTIGIATSIMALVVLVAMRRVEKKYFADNKVSEVKE